MVQVHGVEIPATYEEAVQALAEAHGEVHGPDTLIYRCDDAPDRAPEDAERVRLLEVSRRFPSVRRGDLRAIDFGRGHDFPFLSSVLLVSPADLDRIRSGSLELPEGWCFEPGRRVWPT